MYLRRWLHETPVFQEMQQRKTLPLKTVLTQQKGGVELSMLLTWLLSACIVVVILMAPALMQKQHGISAALSLQANCLATVMLLAGCVITGWLVDWMGAAKTLMGSSLLLALFLQPDADSLFVNYGLAGLSVGVVGVVPFLMVRAFPAAVCFTCIHHLLFLQRRLRHLWRPDARFRHANHVPDAAGARLARADAGGARAGGWALAALQWAAARAGRHSPVAGMG
nr:MFS transporter [Candidatus Pantoea persica]